MSMHVSECSIHVYKCIYIYIHIYVYIRYIYIYVYVQIYVHIYRYIHICMYLYIYVYIFMYLYICILLYIYMCVYIYISICRIAVCFPHTDIPNSCTHVDGWGIPMFCGGGGVEHQNQGGFEPKCYHQIHTAPTTPTHHTPHSTRTHLPTPQRIINYRTRSTLPTLRTSHPHPFV